MEHQALLAALAMALTFVAYVPYVRSILAGTTRPHVFSWLVWGVNTTVAFLATLAAGGGAGAWSIGVSAAVTLGIARLAWLRRSAIRITRADWGFFICGLAALPLWFVLDDPLAAVVVVTLVELAGFAPTFRKSWHLPWSEPVGFLLLLVVRNTLVIGALGERTFTTAFFPAAMAAACVALMAVLLWRRRQLAPAV